MNARMKMFTCSPKDLYKSLREEDPRNKILVVRVRNIINFKKIVGFE